MARCEGVDTTSVIYLTHVLTSSPMNDNQTKTSGIKTENNPHPLNSVIDSGRAAGEHHMVVTPLFR